MYSKFFNGFLVLFFPDRLFKKTIKEKTPFRSLASLLLFAFLIVSVGVYFIKKVKIPTLNTPLSAVLLMILGTYFVLIIITAAGSWFFNWIYLIAITTEKKRLNSDFVGSFLCHAYIIPYWVFLTIFYMFFSEAVDDLWVMFSFVCIIIRLLDIEARLIKVVYKLRLIQGYIIVFMEALLVTIGMLIGYFSRYFLL